MTDEPIKSTAWSLPALRLPRLGLGSLLTAATVLFAAMWFYPVWATFARSLSDGNFLAEYHRVITTTQLPLWYLNSIATSAGVTFGVLATGATCGYALSQLHFPGRKLLWWIVLVSFAVPVQALIISHFFLMFRMGFINSWMGVILPQLIAPLAVIVYKQHFDSLPKELREAGIMDSASEFRMLFKLYLPLSGGITAGLGIITFIGAWNAFLWPFLAVTRDEKMNVAVAIDQVPGAGNSTVVMAALPAIVVFLVFQKRIIAAITTQGSIKG